ncbi:MAG: NAD-dependent epimerase/dehydratase family protein [Bacteroidales bacterium]|jgi:UDP-2-acetamido-2,6-beta-L-arabino-hexul-4-ose reductase|nr:NAD-dependent epimerase/dehydratase family protein [Bacteroidales bacterium]
MKKVGITGQAGFIGTYLFNYLKIKEEIEVVPFKDTYFDNPDLLNDFVAKCDVIVHLAAVNRCDDQEKLYQTNINLVHQLINALDRMQVTPHIIFSSSIQEERDNLYGKSKHKGRELFSLWARQHQSLFTGLVIPNVFGPFGTPYYNSVVATFCYQLTHGQVPIIDTDGVLQLIYVGELVECIYQVIFSNKSQEELLIPPSVKKKVSQVLELLNIYKEQYYINGIIPDLLSSFKLNLFNTFRSYIDIKKYFPSLLQENKDERGSFVEAIKLYAGGQVSYSVTKPGITRGNHYHTRKIERFIIIQGSARIQIRKIGTSEILEFHVSHEVPTYIDMPIWYTHNITNVGQGNLLTLFWINEQFDPNDSDTYFEPV